MNYRLLFFIANTVICSNFLSAAELPADERDEPPQSGHYAVGMPVPINSMMIQITPNNLRDWCQLNDREVSQEVDSFFKEQKVLVAEILRYRGVFEPAEEMRQERLMLNEKLQEAGYKNLSAWNYVFQLPKSGYFVKLPGVENQQENYNAALGLPYGHPLIKAELDTFKQHNQQNRHTYQGISRAAYYVLVKQTIALLHLEEFIEVPATYVVPRIQHWDPIVDDLTYAIVQAPVRNAKPITHALLKARKHQLSALTEATGLWNLSAKNLLQTQDNKIALPDLEQPSYTSPLEFFHRNPARFKSNAKEGLVSLQKTLKELEQKES